LCFALVAHSALADLVGQILRLLSPSQAAVWFSLPVFKILPVMGFNTLLILDLMLPARSPSELPYHYHAVRALFMFLLIRRIYLCWRRSDWSAPASAKGLVYVLAAVGVGFFVLAETLLIASFALKAAGLGWGWAFASLPAVHTVPIAFLLAELLSLRRTPKEAPHS